VLIGASQRRPQRPATRLRALLLGAGAHAGAGRVGGAGGGGEAAVRGLAAWLTPRRQPKTVQAEGLDGPGRTAWPGRRAVPGSRAGQGQAGPVWSGPVQALDERVRRGGANSAGSRTVSPENPSPTLRGRFYSLAALVKTTPRVEGGPAPSQCGLLLGLFPGGGLVAEYFDRSVAAAAAATTLGARRQSRIESSSRFTGNGIWRPDREGLFQPMPLKCHPNCDPISP
jgi:hypothetical protein